MKQATNHFWVSSKRKLQTAQGVASFIRLTWMHREGMDADSAAAMQLFLTNPQPRSPSPSPTQPSSSTPLHMLLPNPSSSLHTFHTPQSAETVIGNSPIPPPSSQFTWSAGAGGENSNKIGIPESQGISLSLSSSLQQLEAAKGDKLRMGDGVFYYKLKKVRNLRVKENRRLGVVF